MTLRGRVSVLVAALAAALVLVTGLAGAYGYWESYYEHRGFDPVHLIRGAHPGRREWVHFYSPALHREYDYLVYLPPGYDPLTHRYPVYYLLHGSPGRPQVFTGIASMGTRMDNLIHRGRMQPMILVFPDGRIGGNTYSDSEWANTPSGHYASYVVDVVHDVDRRFATVDTRAARVIAGFSAGAYGAVNVALQHLRVFGNVQSWSGYYRQTRSGVFAHASPAALAANSPLDYAGRLRGRMRRDPLRAFLFIGRDDDSSPQQRPLALALARDGAQVNYALYHGGHDWQLWHAHVNQMLILASYDARHPLRPGHGHAHTLTPGVRPLPHGSGRQRRRAPVLSLRRPRRHHHRHRRVLPGRLQLVALHVRLHLRRAGHLSLGVLVGGLLLALVSAALINLGFLLQHRGLRSGAETGLGGALRHALRNPTWLGGQFLGWIGFGTQILSVAIAPLALVQAFAAGGLALSVPLAARIFGHRTRTGQRSAVLIMAAALAVLPVGYGAAHDRLDGDTLAVCIGVIAVLAVAVVPLRHGVGRAIAAGAFYGIADAAIKAVTVGLGSHGLMALASAWTAVAALGTFAGFLAFQSALQRDSAIGAISLMTGFSALAATACGLIAFGESLGANTAAVIAHAIAVLVVLACVPELAAAQAEMAEAGPASAAPATPACTARCGSTG